MKKLLLILIVCSSAVLSAQDIKPLIDSTGWQSNMSVQITDGGYETPGGFGRYYVRFDPPVRQYWAYWNSNLWRLDEFPDGIRPRILLNFFDDGYYNCADIHNIGMDNARYHRVLSLFSGDGLTIDRNNHIYVAGENGEPIPTRRLDIEKVKKRLLIAIKQSKR